MEDYLGINKEDDSVEENMPPDTRSWLERTFGRLPKGALRGAIFSLVSSAIGAGCLTLPVLFKNQGIILGVALITFAIYLSYYSLISIAIAGEKYKIFSYNMLTEAALGKIWGFIIESSIILYVFGTIVGYQIMIGFIVPSILGSLDLSESGSTNTIIIMAICNVVFITPLSMFRELTSLRFVSLLCGFSLIYISLLVIAEFPLYAIKNSWDSLKWFNIDLRVISGFNICLFSSTCHTNIPQIQGELFNSNLRRISKVSLRAILAIYFPYLSLGLFGYLSTLNDTPSLIIMREKPSLLPNDFLMVIGRVLMVLTLIIAVPVNIPPSRTAIIKSWLRYKEQPPLYVYFLNRHVIVTEGLLLTSLAIAIVFPQILLLFSILGGFLGGLIVLLVPGNQYSALLRWKACEYTGFKAYLLIGIFVFLFLMGTTGAILSVIGYGQ